MSEWKEYKLGDVCSLITDGSHFSPKDSQSEFPMASVKDLTRYGINYESCRTISENDFNLLVKNGCQPQINDVLIAKDGNSALDTVCLHTDNRAVVLLSSVAILRPSDLITPNFLRYYLDCSTTRNFLKDSFRSGSAIPRVILRDFRLAPIPLPSLPEQRAIAAVLSSLDDKIDLLHRQNTTLEALAETLFRQWFVEEADDGWEEESLLTLIQLVGGGTPKTSISDYWDGNIPWLAGRDIASNHKTFVLNTEKTITDNGLNNSSAKLLPKYATVISARGTVGKYCLLSQPMTFSQSNYGILPRIDNCYFFTYLLINHVVEELQASAYGSVFDTITTTTFKENNVLIPTESEVRAFENSVSVYFDKIFHNTTQIRTLEKLRDTLLPKLMSGKVRLAGVPGTSDKSGGADVVDRGTGANVSGLAAPIGTPAP